MEKTKNHMFTKTEIKTIMSLLESKTVREIALELNISIPQVNYVVLILKRNGIKLTRKRLNGTIDSLVKEILNEQN